MFLAKQGISCTLVDKATFPRDKICGDALSGKALEVFKKLDASIIDELVKNSTAIDSWGVTFVAPNGEPLRIPFSKNKSALKNAPGFIMKRIDFDDFLFEKAKQNPLISIHENTELRSFIRTQNGIDARDKNDNVFSSKLFIAADGAHSAFAKQIAMLKTEPEHNCFGLRAYYKNVQNLDAEGFIELHFIHKALPGYFWIFPLPNGEANVGIGIRADKLDSKNINLKKLFFEIVESEPQIKERFANAELQDNVKLYGLPLGSKKRKLSGDNYMLCGDAAMLIDPFTGEGIGNALLSGMYAAQQAEICIQQNNFSSTILTDYDKQVYQRLWKELQLSYSMQRLINFPLLFNFVVKKANRNEALREAIMSMFEDIDLRSKLKDPKFYFKILFSPK
ncbi:MAG: geranylgeranyl reductase family protein [Chitinophagales bacterium]|nr:geranylgeranyl reductase family protein [Chitinophagales bacterium]